jgi:hypothetical protein
MPSIGTALDVVEVLGADAFFGGGVNGDSGPFGFAGSFAVRGGSAPSAQA